MSSKRNHAKRSKRSSHIKPPFEMFARNARWAKYKKDRMKEVQS